MTPRKTLRLPSLATKSIAACSLLTAQGVLAGENAGNSALPSALVASASEIWPWLTVVAILLAIVLGAVAVHLRARNQQQQLAFDAERERAAQKHKSLEDQLDRADRRLRGFFADAIVGIALARPDGSYKDANARWCESLGYSHDEICHMHNLAITHPEDVETSRKHLQALIAGEIPSYSLEKRFVRKDGSVLWAALLVAPIRDENGKVDTAVGVIQDISERKLADERLRRILRELPIATMVLNGAGHAVYRSDRFTALFGYSEAEVPSLAAWLPLAYPDAEYRCRIENTIAGMVAQARRDGHASGPAEARVRCRDGSEKIIEFHYVDLDEQGIWTMSDITERHAFSEALRAANDHLVARLGEIQLLQDKLQEQAMRDALTGLFNRRYLDVTLERELARALREGLPLTMMMLDIDHFKKLNDTYGHQAGDEVLKALSDMLRTGARTEDIPCRYGGEEFLLVLPNMNLDAAIERAEQWRRKFEEMHIVFGQLSMAATLSIGIATFPGHGRTRDALVEAADKALYSAKHKGRNRVEVWAG